MSDWIKLSDQKPKKSGSYLVTLKRFSVDDVNHTGKYVRLVQDSKWDDTKQRFMRAAFFEPVAWMPKPAPYTEEGED